MNPGQFNRRIKFMRIDYTKNQYGGTTPVITDILTTWGALKPYRQYNMQVEQAGATALGADITLIIRFRNSFTPTEDMLFQDVSEPGYPVYSIKSISSYYPGAKQAFENSQETVYQNRLFVYLVGIKQDNTYLNLYS